MKTKVRMSDHRQPIPMDKLRKILRRIVNEMNKRSKEGMPTTIGMRAAIKLGFLEYEEDANNITINNFGDFAGIHQFVVLLPEKNTTVDVAIFFE